MLDDSASAIRLPKVLEVAFLDGFDHANGSNILKLAPHGRRRPPCAMERDS